MYTGGQNIAESTFDKHPRALEMISWLTNLDSPWFLLCVVYLTAVKYAKRKSISRIYYILLFVDIREREPAENHK